MNQETKKENTEFWKSILAGCLFVFVFQIAGPLVADWFSVPKYKVTPVILLISGIPLYFVSFKNTPNIWSRTKRDWNFSEY